MKTSRVIKNGLLLAGTAAAFGTGRLFQNVIVRKKKEATDYVVPPDVVDGEKRQKLWRDSNHWLNEREKEEVSIQSFDGLTLAGELFLVEEPKATVLLVHGYRSNRRREFAVMAKFFIESGYNVLLVDDRAHGKSEGRYVGFGCLDREDCYRWVQYLNRRFHGTQDIFLLGISMGAATVLMASNLNLPSTVKGIVADCGFTSPREEFIHVLTSHSHGYYSRLLLGVTSLICKITAGYGFNDCSSVKSVEGTKIPVFVIHGTKDDFVPTRMGREIYEACASKKELWLVEGAGHAESYYLRREDYEKRVLAFFKKCQKDGVHGR